MYACMCVCVFMNVHVCMYVVMRHASCAHKARHKVAHIRSNLTNIGKCCMYDVCMYVCMIYDVVCCTGYVMYVVMCHAVMRHASCAQSRCSSMYVNDSYQRQNPKWGE